MVNNATASKIRRLRAYGFAAKFIAEECNVTMDDVLTTLAAPTIRRKRERRRQRERQERKERAKAKPKPTPPPKVQKEPLEVDWEKQIADMLWEGCKLDAVVAGYCDKVPKVDILRIHEGIVAERGW